VEGDWLQIFNLSANDYFNKDGINSYFVQTVISCTGNDAIYEMGG